MAANENAEQSQQAEPTAENGGNARNAVRDTLKSELRQAMNDAARDILAPAMRQVTQEATKYAVSKGPEIAKGALPGILKATGAANPQELRKQAIAKGGEMLSGAGGITGIAGKLMPKLGGGKGGGAATGYGVKRRMPVQQDMFVSVPLTQAYNGWTEYKRWTEYMHRANLVDPEITDEGVRLKVTEQMWGFKRPFTAEVVEQRPDEFIRWNSTEGTSHVGVIDFHELAPRLTLISVNLDHAPSGPIEKLARGNRFVKRAVRADLHRFKGWIEHRSPDELEEIEGWRGTIEDGQITKTHEDALMESEEAEEPEAEEAQGEPEDEGKAQDAEESQDEPEDDEEAYEGEEEEEEPEEEAEPEEQEEEEPQPTPRRRRTTASKRMSR